MDRRKFTGEALNTPQSPIRSVIKVKRYCTCRKSAWSRASSKTAEMVDIVFAV